MAAHTVDALISLIRRRGFVYPAGEIYGRPRSAWDYGPLGVELKENVKRAWWRAMVQLREDVVGMDSAIVLPREVWVGSGHVEGFAEPLTECLACHRKFAADTLLEGYKERTDRAPARVPAESTCPRCGAKNSFTEATMFSTLLGTKLGADESAEATHYLRPEPAQAAFLNFRNVLGTSRLKLPFGVAQAGTSFRNELMPNGFIFRTPEFEQLAMDFFVEPGTAEAWHEYWFQTRWDWYVDHGITPANLARYESPPESLPHYAKRNIDIQYRFGLDGSDFGELEGIANRSDYDLSRHAARTGADLSYFDQGKGARFTPHVIEASAGLARAMLAFLLEAYDTDQAANARGGLDGRTVLRLDARLAPVKAAVLPLSRGASLSPLGHELASSLRMRWNVEFDDSGAIGRRYRRQDEIGTPFCVTVDFDSLDDGAVTVRERDSMRQDRVATDRVEEYLAQRLPAG